MKNTDVSTSCVGNVVKDEDKENITNSSSANSNDFVSKSDDSNFFDIFDDFFDNPDVLVPSTSTPPLPVTQPTVGKYMPPKQANQSACCKCACGNNQR